MRWGLTAEQVADRAIAQNPPPVVEPVADVQEAVAAIEDAIDEVDATQGHSSVSATTRGHEQSIRLGPV